MVVDKQFYCEPPLVNPHLVQGVLPNKPNCLNKGKSVNTMEKLFFIKIVCLYTDIFYKFCY
jgi:hypothetical protein